MGASIFATTTRTYRGLLPGPGKALGRISSSQTSTQRGAAVLSGGLRSIPAANMDALSAGQQLDRTAAFNYHHPVSTPMMWPSDQFWRKVPVYEDVTTSQFLSYRWSTMNTVSGEEKLFTFLNAVVPKEVPFDDECTRTQTKEDFLMDVVNGVRAATMSIRITPYVLSRINWKNPRNDPIFRQFIPLNSMFLPDHPKLTLDSLHETADSPVKGLVHRYPDKALFLATSICPTYCTYCTRCYAVGADTELFTKDSIKPSLKRWHEVFAYIESQPQLQDIVISGGDSYYLTPEHIRLIGERLINIPHVRRLRYASKGLAVAPGRLVDPQDGWASALIDVANMAREADKSVALHTHFNHPDEISWVTEMAARRLHMAGVTVRNQSVLLKGINDSAETMSSLIRKLAGMNVNPYYVYICDLVKMNEHRRTTLQSMLDIEAQVRGSIAGFMMPQFVVDLPGGGGKRLAHSFKSYDRESGVSRFVAPAVTANKAAGRGGDKPEVYEYYDPISPATQ